MIIDGHAHIWKPSLGFDIKPLSDHPEFRRDFLLADLRKHCTACGIDRVVITQSAPQVEETEFLLAQCRNDPLVAGVTGWVNLRAPDICATLDRLMAEPKFVGIRAQLRRIPDTGFISSSDVRRGLDAVAERDLSIVLLAEERHLPLCLSLLQDAPQLRTVLNHGGMPDLVNGDMGRWCRTMAMIADRTSAAVQVSGFVSLAQGRWTPAFVELVFGHLLDCFGAARLMFTSDWPMTELHASYDEWWGIFNRACDHLNVTDEQRALLLGGVVRKVHKLDQPGRLCPTKTKRRDRN